MKQRLLALIAAAAAALALLAAPLSGAAPPRIVAVGDVHGAFDAYTGILRSAGLLDAQNAWIGGRAVLVQTGDVTDRGAGVRPVMDLLMALEPQASRAGGRVEVLLGNHEIMNLVGNTRDATEEIFASFGGYAEYRKALGPGGRYGRWLRSKRAAIEIEGTLFMHAGLAPDHALGSVDAVNRQVRADLKAWDDGAKWLEERKLVAPSPTMQDVVTAAQGELVKLDAKRTAGTLTEEDLMDARRLVPLATVVESSLFAGDGPMWFRGYATWSDEDGAPRAAALLKKFRVERIVSGHSPVTGGRIQARFGGTVFLIDTGMLGPPSYPTGRASALEIAGDVVTAIYTDQRVPLRQ